MEQNTDQAYHVQQELDESSTRMKFPEAPFLFSTLGHILLICGITFYILQVKLRSPFVKWSVLLLCVGVSFLPVQGLPVVGYLRGLLGDLSVPTQIFLGCSLIHHLLKRDLLSTQDRWFILKMIGVGGLMLYPMSGGYWAVDSYSVGYDSTNLLLFLIPLTLWTWHTHPRVAVVLLISAGAFNLKILESTNLWDYLLDPGVTIYAWGTILLGVLRR